MWKPKEYYEFLDNNEMGKSVGLGNREICRIAMLKTLEKYGIEVPEDIPNEHR
jgi:hypothetical protein